MKITKLLSVILCCLIGLSATAQQRVVDGNLDTYKKFKSDYVASRDVYVWTPYDYNPLKKYAVLYMHDGQMLFDKNTTWNGQEWNVDAICGKLIRSKILKDFIVVGMANVNDVRFYDYCPQKILKYVSEQDILDAKVDISKFNADNYLKFIVTEVKPFIDKNYSTYTDKEHTFIMGSSMGGLISLYAVCEYPKVFGGAGCLSTHTPILTDSTLSKSVFDNWAAAFVKYAENNLPKANSCKIYMDRGDQTLDANYPEYQYNLDQVFKKKGWNNKKWVSKIFPGKAHTENDWSERLDNPLLFLMTNNKMKR